MAKYSCRPAPKNLLSPKQPAKKTGFAKPVLIAVLAGAAVVVGAVVWIVIATIGKKPKDININTNIKADGVFVTEGSVSSSAVTAEKEGIVSEVLVSDGDQVSAGQQIALLDSEEAQTKLDELTARRDSVDKVTFDSKNDPITDDTKKLLDIKSQWITTSSELDTNKALLKTKENELAEQQKKVTEAKNAQEEARKAYNAISATTTADTTSQQNAYTDARSALQTAIDDQESAEAALALAQDKLDDLLAQLKPLEGDLADAKTTLSEAQANAMSAESHMKDMESDMLAAKSNWESAVFAFQNAGPNEDRPALAAAADAAKSSYDNAYDFYTDAQRAYDTAASMVKDAQDKVDECQKPIDDLEPKIAKAREELASAQDLADACNASLSTAQTNYDNARKDFTEAAGMDDTAVKQKFYEDAKADLETVKQKQESAEAAVTQAQEKVDGLLEQRKPLEDDLGDAKNALSEAQANAMSAESHMKDMESDMLAAKSNWESAVFAFQNAGPNEDRPALAAAADAAKSSYDNAYDFYTDAQRAYDTAASMVKDAQDKVDECQKPIDDLEPKIAKAREELASAQDLADAWKDKVAAAQTTCDEAEKAYEDAKQAQAKRQADISNAYTKYQEASNAYSKATKDLTVLQNSVDQLKARIAVQEANLTKQETELLQKFNSTKDSILEQLDQEIAENKQIIEEAVILSTMDGVISGINIAKGDAVEQGTTVCDIVYDSNTEQKVICYVPAAEAGKLKTGMSVDIVVSGFDEKEYGHLEGTVQNVAKSGSSQDKVAVTIALRADSDTVSGFWWSANNGASVTIADGTAVTAEFIAKG